MTIFVVLIAVVFFVLLFFTVFPQGKKFLRDRGPKSTDPGDPNNSNWNMPKN